MYSGHPHYCDSLAGERFTTYIEGVSSDRYVSMMGVFTSSNTCKIDIAFSFIICRKKRLPHS